MSEKRCKFCGGEFESTFSGFICRDCGDRPDRVDWATESENGPLFETVEKKVNWKKPITIIACLLVVCTIVACGRISFSNNKIQRIIEKNGFENSIDIKTVEEISKIELEPDVPGLPLGYSLVLLNSDDSAQYSVALVNYSSEQMQLFDYGGYFPLAVIVDDYVSCLPEREQVEHLGYLAKYINEYGVDCFESRDVAEAYIKEIGNFYDVRDARSAIEISALSKLPNSQNINDFKVIFEGETAVPLYYAFMTKSLERNPNWGYIDVDSLNAIQVDFFLRQLGPVYIEEEIWHAYSRDFNLMDSSFRSSTYNELEEALLRTHQIVYGNEYTEEADESNDINSGVQTLAPSSDKEVATEKIAPKIFWTMDIAYHLENCQAISGVDAEEISWSMAQEIGLRQCPECNPPRYEDYVSKTINKEKQQENNSRDVLYRVRKSADDKDSQLGAFENLENAKKLADQHSSDGYKVFDGVGNCVYEP